MLRDGAKLADATQRVVMFFPRAGMPIDVSDERVQRARATRNASVTGASGRGDQTSQTSVTIRGRSLDVSCSLNENLLPAELAQLVNEHLASAAWDSVETAFRKPLRVSGAPRRASASGRVAEVFGARVAINCGGGDLRAASRSDSQAELFKVGPTWMECEIGMGFMETWTVHAEFYPHGELFCLVFGKCMPDWTMEDTWWGQGDIVVDESTMSWEEWIGYEPPAVPCNPALDPSCVRLMEPAERALRDAATGFIKDPSTIADPAKRARCTEMKNALDLYISKDSILVSKVQDPPINVQGGHFGAYVSDPASIHLDPIILSLASQHNWAKWELANTMLHEAAHSIGKDHPDTEGYAIGDILNGGTIVYTSDYFSDLNPGTSSCLKTKPTN